jgi:hypothetical protein
VVRDDAARASYSQTLVKRYNNGARVKLKFGDVAGARAHAASARELVERLVAKDPRDVGSATMLAGVLAMASSIEYEGGRYQKTIELARASIAADARLPPEVRAGLIVRENVVGAKLALAASACTLAQTASQARSHRIALLKEAQSLLAESRLFKRELVDRGIDAREAASAILEIDAELERCNAAIARLG